MVEEVLFRQAFQAANVGIGMLDINNRWLKVNPAFCEMVGYSEEELLYMTDEAITFPDDLKHEAELKDKLFKKEIKNLHIEKRYIHKDRSILWVSLHISMVFNENDQPQCFIIHAEDITMKRQTEQTIVENEQTYRLIAEQSADIVGRYYPDGTIFYCSPSVREILGYEPCEVINKTPYDYVHPDDQHKLAACHNQVTNTNKEKTCARFRTKDNTFVWLESIIKSIKDPTTDQPKEMIAFSRDVTTRVTAEHELKKSKQRLEQLFKHIKRSLDGVTDSFITVDKNFCFTFINKEAEQVLNHSRTKLIGKNLWSTFPELVGTNFDLKLHQAFAERCAIQSEFYFPTLDDWFHFRIYPTEEGALIYFLNITKRKQIETKLSESEERYRSLVEFSPESIVVHINQKVVYINPAGVALLGATDPSDVIGKRIWDFFPEENHDVLYQSFRQNLNGNHKQRFTGHQVTTLDGETKHIEFTTKRIMYEGKPAVKAILRDVSERKKYEELMSKSEKLSLVGQLAAGVAHEVRNPLTSIKGFVQIFQASKSYNDEFARIILDELDRVESIIYEFLTLAKPNQEMVFKKLDLKLLLEQVVTLLDTQAMFRDHQIFTDFDELPFVECEENQLKQVFVNIIQNALEAMSSKGAVYIKLKRHSEETISIDITDTGRGMSDERIRQLGEPFYSNKEKGTGLGLMVCFKIIEHHNGNIHFSSKVGKGTTVTITLPIKQNKHAYELISQ
ncbi:PAS domain-containing protein [Desertibacillus haloalkaliphilus]|uniref:PAS domain-containing protein n=1 Tax=Desertibacillus haloalkaliphilus TaxID=1328930 RepID=UPI001C2641B9|nr:PAS domain S-box protein [Desertibacillus haloalkaliphilus]MBU8905299.1 PAS domain S-box protein [Desertibacillus haloalkaliphilus]